ncbi:DNA-directed RNA polymerase III subunit RPC7-like [Actinia tenebrosa]|uniref:DNA-directed RNA polymerase III subunit n=1 Tax=Actinia tenebrosa TaxID=6105 RepID=A0A6P8IBB1_ACTTE|nr:DNA-directed RNA polymerase III subunit RPC7-like [Actinia tenebrosa]XP_031564561.1 DNA-directed RNA polymerase III subunit RPC7-like [Actinia tenebrosa]
MAGRGGRGRGKGRGFTFDIGSIGFGRGGDALPASILQPPPLFPPLEKIPLPLRKTEADETMLQLKQDIKYMLNTSPYYVKPKIINKDIERYSDRYKEKPQDNLKFKWEPDWSYIPSELKIRIGRPKLRHSGVLKPNMRKSRKSSEKSSVDLEKLEELEKEGTTDKQSQENKPGESKEGEASDDDVDEEEEYDEEEQEEENDYLVSHFDDDEDLAEDDDMDEGPIY